MTEPYKPVPEASPEPAPTAPVEPSAAATTPAQPSPSMPSTSVLVLGFVIMVLLGALLALNLRQKNQAPIEGETSEVIATRLKKDADKLIAMTERVQGQLTEKDALISAKTAALLEAEQGSQALVSKITSLKTDLDKALANTTAGEVLKRQLAEAQSQADTFSNELTKARNQLAEFRNRPTTAELAEAKRQLAEANNARAFFETRVKELEARLAELSKGRLFAASENELLPTAVELYRRLQKLENHTDSDLLTAYSGIATELGATKVSTVTFPTGSSTPTPADDDIIRSLARKQPDEGLILVVGYASETGNVDENRVLSSDRATAVAKSLDALKSPGQKVQAVYLGQTDRFGSKFPERNQICEVWHIRPKN